MGSGKSFFAEERLSGRGYEIASNDATGGREKTVKLMLQHLREGRSVVLDNTHGNKESRKVMIQAIKKVDENLRIRCFVMQTSPQQARHNNIFRELTGSKHVKIKEPLFNSYM